MATKTPKLHYFQYDKWMNDPNGLIFHNGIYHLYYQCNPDSKYWGNIGWGHATSEDLITWTEQPHALPAKPGAMIFSGSIAAPDDAHSKGNEKASLYAFYTVCDYDPQRLQSDNVLDIQNQRQHLALSDDNGITWNEYRNNPLIHIGSTEFRDPKVQQLADGEWLMLVARSLDHKIDFYYSEDLLSWTLTSTFTQCPFQKGAWECPDLILLCPQENIWCLMLSVDRGFANNGSGVIYMLGNLVDKAFVINTAYMGGNAYVRLDHGPDFFAPQSFFHNGQLSKPLMLGWLNSWLYAKEMPAQSLPMMQSVPRELGLVKVDDQCYLLSQHPALSQAKVSESSTQTVSGLYSQQALFSDIPGTFLWEAEIHNFDQGQLSLSIVDAELSLVTIVIDSDEKTMRISRHTGDFFEAANTDYEAPYLSLTSMMDISILADCHSVEIFVNQGTTVFSLRLSSAMDNVSLLAESTASNLKLQSTLSQFK